MAKTVGILLSSNFDLYIQSKRDADGKIISGLTLGNSVYQQQTLILAANKGDYKLTPRVGVGLNNYLLDDASNDDMFQEIRSQFTADGMRVYTTSIENGKLEVNANYEDGSQYN